MKEDQPNARSDISGAQVLDMEQQLRLLSTAVNAAANGIVLTDRNGRLLWANPSFSVLTGYDWQEVTGKNLSFLKSGAHDDAFYRSLWDTIQTGRVWQGDMVNRRKDGTIYYEEQTITPVVGTGGGITNFIAIKQDVSARRKAEQALEEQYRVADRARAETRAVLDATSDAMMMVALDGTVLTINRNFNLVFFDDAPSDLVGQPVDQLGAHWERVFAGSAMFPKLLQDSLAGPGRQFTQSLSQVWPVKRELLLYSTPVHKENGERLGRLYVWHDVTQEREADRMKSEFVSMVSHELRTPLTSIQGFADLVLDGDAGNINEEQREYLGIIKQNTIRLTTLINDLLEVSRIEAGRIKVNPQVVSAGEIIQTVVGALELQLRQKGQEVIVELDPRLTNVLADRDRTIQVLTNLISNAHKYSPAGGAIRIRADTRVTSTAGTGDTGPTGVSPGYALISVSDNGVGISAEDQAMLFTRFYRVENSLTRQTSGTGLGLYIAKELVELQGGTISVDSQPNEGSTFAFTLPLA
jgi:PAS domain S-box-containing protein